MDNSRKTLMRLILIIFILFTASITIWAQENETRTSSQQEVNLTAAKNTSYIVLSQNINKEVMIEAQRNLDRSLDILNIAATLFAAVVGILTIILFLVGGFGFLEIQKWREARKNIDNDIEIIKEIKNKAEKELEDLRKRIEKNSILSLDEIPSEDIQKNFEDFSSRLELLEMLGASLNSEDYHKRATDFYYKGKYELAIKALEKAIELEPDNHITWNNKGVAFSKIGRHGDALKANEKAIKLEPDNGKAWMNKGVALHELGRNDEALKAYEKVIELKPDYTFAWFNRACTYSTMGYKEKALSCLRNAINLDIKIKEEAKKDKALEILWADESFKKLVE